ncbi:NosD domain-containing protein [Microlunatus flavus]|uniref:Right handed beta helix region n=1 Tax=Microlunatus flavus TaxID=1036181 RepID=A0A1H9FDV3_9ACTN|nr:right-handed parallel beta-helix repeat-containing protein [Microlunatus flavus]SEQ36121.1 Right handed beta helix region [Microlunatus flavus]
MSAPTSITPAHPPALAARTARWAGRATLGLATVAATALVPVASASAASVALPGVLENGSSALVLSGGWKTTKTTTASGGSFSTLSGKSGYAATTFKATGVSWVSRPGPHNGIAKVYLDGKLVKTVDLYRGKTAYKQTVWSVKGLKDTTHSLKIVRTGKKNSASGGANLVVDALRVLDVSAPSAPTGLAAAKNRTGYTLTWNRPGAADLSGYRVFRKVGSGATTQVAWLPAATTKFADVGLANSTRYVYWVKAMDKSGNVSGSSTSVTATTGAATSYNNVRYSACPSATVNVSTWKQLQSAISNAPAGRVIKMAPGTYSVPWGMAVKANGTSTRPVWICGPRTAVLSGPGVTGNGGFRVDGSSYLRIAGMTVRNSQKGISVMRSNHVAVSDVLVEHIGQEAVHLKNNTTDSVVVGNTIRDTGLMTATYGEGVYVGTAKGNWCKYNGCNADASNRNAIVANHISRTSSEPIDLKEGAVDGTVWGNTVDGGSMRVGETLISVQTNNWVVAHNTGSNAKADGIQVWQAYEVWGRNNTLYANRFTSGIPGYGVRVAYVNIGNVVGCDTTVPSSSDGISNKTCQK